MGGALKLKPRFKTKLLRGEPNVSGRRAELRCDFVLMDSVVGFGDSSQTSSAASGRDDEGELSTMEEELCERELLRIRAGSDGKDTGENSIL